jgi:deoxyribodipyrimidine photolyase-related protein
VTRPIRNLVVVLGDQLNLDSTAFSDFDPDVDRVWMAEVSEESEHVWSHQARIVLFLSAMRHFRQELADAGRPLIYHQLADHPYHSLSQVLAADIEKLRPKRIVVVQAGDYRVQQLIASAAQQTGITLDVRPDTHFLCNIEEFEHWASGRKQLRLEYFYREMRARLGILVDGKQPVGGEWNYDKANRQTFGKKGPGTLPTWPSFRPDAITKGVIKEVSHEFREHPGSLASFDWPVTRADAKLALQNFVANRLPRFGAYQDALWSDQPFLYHSGLASAMNVKLVSPAEVIEAAVQAFYRGEAPINSVEGFVRQILGWREYVRGIYWREMPDYLTRNALGAHQPLPKFYWTGGTDMVCLRNTIGQTLEYGYAHHIQRLMVTGLFALLLGVEPLRLHEWYLAIYVDAVEWVEAPNTLGMSQYADGGLLASKPYVATGKYIKRMSNYCENCHFNPDKATGSDACPFTTLYWDFLQNHESRFASHPRTALQWKNLARLTQEDRKTITEQANRIRERYQH